MNNTISEIIEILTELQKNSKPINFESNLLFSYEEYKKPELFDLGDSYLIKYYYYKYIFGAY